MIKKDKFQPNFDISEKAVNYINETLKNYNIQKNEDHVPCIAYILKKNNSFLEKEAPVLAFYKIREIEEDEISQVNKLKFVFAVGNEEAKHFEGKILDYDNDELFLK